MAVRTLEERRRRANNERRRYIIRRLAELRTILPDLTLETLRHEALRQISAGARKAGPGPTKTLGAFDEGPHPSGPFSKEASSSTLMPTQSLRR